MTFPSCPCSSCPSPNRPRPSLAPSHSAAHPRLPLVSSSFPLTSHLLSHPPLPHLQKSSDRSSKSKDPRLQRERTELSGKERFLFRGKTEHTQPHLSNCCSCPGAVLVWGRSRRCGCRVWEKLMRATRPATCAKPWQVRGPQVGRREGEAIPAPQKGGAGLQGEHRAACGGGGCNGESWEGRLDGSPG